MIAGMIRAVKKRVTERLIRIRPTNHTLIRPVKRKCGKGFKELRPRLPLRSAPADASRRDAMRRLMATVTGLRRPSWRARRCSCDPAGPVLHALVLELQGPRSDRALPPGGCLRQTGLASPQPPRRQIAAAGYGSSAGRIARHGRARPGHPSRSSRWMAASSGHRHAET